MEHIQVPNTRLSDLLVALRTEFEGEERPIDLLVVIGTMDFIGMNMTSIMEAMDQIKVWTIKQNPDNTCAFTTVPQQPLLEEGMFLKCDQEYFGFYVF